MCLFIHRCSLYYHSLDRKMLNNCKRNPLFSSHNKIIMGKFNCNFNICCHRSFPELSGDHCNNNIMKYYFTNHKRYPPYKVLKTFLILPVCS